MNLYDFLLKLNGWMENKQSLSQNLVEFDAENEHSRVFRDDEMEQMIHFLTGKNEMGFYLDSVRHYFFVNTQNQNLVFDLLALPYEIKQRVLKNLINCYFGMGMFLYGDESDYRHQGISQGFIEFFKSLEGIKILRRLLRETQVFQSDFMKTDVAIEFINSIPLASFKMIVQDDAAKIEWFCRTKHTRDLDEQEALDAEMVFLLEQRLARGVSLTDRAEGAIVRAPAQENRAEALERELAHDLFQIMLSDDTCVPGRPGIAAVIHGFSIRNLTHLRDVIQSMADPDTAETQSQIGVLIGTLDRLKQSADPGFTADDRTEAGLYKLLNHPGLLEKIFAEIAFKTAIVAVSNFWDQRKKENSSMRFFDFIQQYPNMEKKIALLLKDDQHGPRALGSFVIGFDLLLPSQQELLNHPLFHQRISTIQGLVDCLRQISVEDRETFLIKAKNSYSGVTRNLKIKDFLWMRDQVGRASARCLLVEVGVDRVLDFTDAQFRAQKDNDLKEFFSIWQPSFAEFLREIMLSPDTRFRKDWFLCHFKENGACRDLLQYFSVEDLQEFLMLPAVYYLCQEILDLKGFVNGMIAVCETQIQGSRLVSTVLVGVNCSDIKCSTGERASLGDQLYLFEKMRSEGQFFKLVELLAPEELSRFLSFDSVKEQFETRCSSDFFKMILDAFSSTAALMNSEFFLNLAINFGARDPVELKKYLPRILQCLQEEGAIIQFARSLDAQWHHIITNFEDLERLSLDLLDHRKFVCLLMNRALIKQISMLMGLANDSQPDVKGSLTRLLKTEDGRSLLSALLVPTNVFERSCLEDIPQQFVIARPLAEVKTLMGDWDNCSETTREWYLKARLALPTQGKLLNRDGVPAAEKVELLAELEKVDRETRMRAEEARQRVEQAQQEAARKQSEKEFLAEQKRDLILRKSQEKAEIARVRQEQVEKEKADKAAVTLARKEQTEKEKAAKAAAALEQKDRIATEKTAKLEVQQSACQVARPGDDSDMVEDEVPSMPPVVASSTVLFAAARSEVYSACIASHSAGLAPAATTTLLYTAAAARAQGAVIRREPGAKEEHAFADIGIDDQDL